MSVHYRRTLPVSVERVWENVLDWEHLPYLHASSFGSIQLLETSTSPEFWRAQITIKGVMAGRAIIELRTNRPELSYVTKTLEGVGRGTEILTRIKPLAERSTTIEVTFHLAGVPRLLAPLALAGYKRLYDKLWSEDETMMRHRQSVLDAAAARRAARARTSEPNTPAPIPLGSLSTLRNRLPLVVSTPAGKFRVVALGLELVAHTTTCSHLGGPLANAPIIDGCITCPWHGYRFDIRTGRSAGAHRCKLPPAPAVEIDPVTQQARLVW